MDASKLVSGFIAVILVMALAAGFYPTMVDYGDSLNASGLPFGEFVADGGLAWLIMGIVLFIGVVGLLGWKVTQ